MVDIALGLLVTRTLFGMGDLDLNDHDAYVVSATDFMTQSQQWTRNQVGSAYTDGQVTVSRYKNLLSMPLSIEVLGEDQVDLTNNKAVLVAAFSQDSFILKSSIDGVDTWWACEAADYTMERSGPRLSAYQMQLVFGIPTQPNPLVGSF